MSGLTALPARRALSAVAAPLIVAGLLALPAAALDAPTGPVAAAGPDQTVPESAVVQLDGSASTAAVRRTLDASARRAHLPGGTALGVELVDLAAGDGGPVARGAVELGTGTAARTTSVAYVVDVSASTEDPARCGGDANGDGLVDTVLDCEVAAALRLHEEVLASGTVDRVALVAFSSRAEARDLDPTAGEAVLVAPDADADGDGVLDVVQALRSLRDGGGTNFVNSSSLACQVLAGADSENRLGVFLSDGLGAGDLRTVLPCAPPVTFEVFAAGAGSSCTSGEEWSRLQDLAALTGGTCRGVPRVADLPDLLPEVIASHLTDVSYTVDGGPAFTLVAGVPAAGPVRLPVEVPLPDDDARHEVCLTAGGRDSGGAGSATTCSEVGTAPGTLTHAWSQVSGPAAGLQSSGARAGYTAADDGRQVFELAVTDADGAAATDQVTVDVVNVAPRLQLDLAREAGGGARVTATVTDAGLHDTHVVEVSWGDGTTATLPVTAQAPGRGSVELTHTWSAPGSYDVEVVAVDDDGGRATARLDGVEVRPAPEPEVRPDVALWAASTSAASSLDWTSGAGSVTGRVHSNGRLRLSGGLKRFTGPTTYAGSLVADAARTTFSSAPEATGVQPFPFRPDLASYRPGGEVAREAGTAYRDMSSRCSGGSWQPTGTVLAPGVYYARCDIQLNGADLGGRVTLVSEGRVRVYGSRPLLEPYARGYLAIAGATGSRALDISTSGSAFAGTLFAEHGQVSLSGNGNTFRCGVLGDQVSISGNELDIRSGGCARG